MVGGKSSQEADRTVRWSCSVRGKEVSCNSLGAPSRYTGNVQSGGASS